MQRADGISGGASLEHELQIDKEAGKDDGLKENDLMHAKATSHKRQREFAQSGADPKPEACEPSPRRTRRCVHPAPVVEGLAAASTPVNHIGPTTSEDDGRDSEKTLILGQTSP